MSQKKRYLSKTAADNPRRKGSSNTVEAQSHETMKASPEERSALTEKGGFLVYTGPVHGSLKKGLDEQRENRADQLYGGQR